MKKNDEGGGYILSTGRHVKDGAGGIGIDDRLEVSAGHDQYLDMEGASFYDDNLNDAPWTPEEKVELADFMIGLWAQFRAREVVTFKGCTFESEPPSRAMIEALRRHVDRVHSMRVRAEAEATLLRARIWKLEHGERTEP